MISKAFCVRIPPHELAAVESLLAQFPGVSPALLIRALLLASGRVAVANALARHAVGKVGNP
jgi:hypothetical protein